MKVLVTGSKGQLGFDVLKVLREKDIECIGIDIDNLDITVEKDVVSTFEEYNPDVVVHCAAYTAVDNAEDDRERCYTINSLGTKYVAEACKKIGAKLFYISTDYVFDGSGDIPFEVNDRTSPVNYYGYTKREGERNVIEILERYFILRISWVFGINGKNFVKTMLNLSKSKDSLSIVSDQIGSPTYTKDVASLISIMMHSSSYGVYHVTNAGYCSWYEFAEAIFKFSEIEMSLKKVLTKDFETKAVRPLNSRLSKVSLTKKGFITPRSWEEALRDYLSELKRDD